MLRLVKSGDRARLELAEGMAAGGDVVRLSPRVRDTGSDREAIPSIPPGDIQPFLSKPLVVGQDELEGAPRIVATADGRVTMGPSDRAFVVGLTKDKGDQWQIFRRGDPLIDPDNGQILGYEAIYLGEARVVQHGNVATVEIVRSVMEIHRNDRLLPLGKQAPVFAYVPQPPKSAVKGRIISAYGGLQETGPLSIVTLSRGSKDGLQVGTVLAIERSQTSARYSLRTAPLFGRSGPSGSDAPRTYYGEAMPPREVLLDRGEAITNENIAQLPDQRYGLVMVFRTFDRASFALVMEASRPVAVSDYVTNP